MYACGCVCMDVCLHCRLCIPPQVSSPQLLLGRLVFSLWLRLWWTLDDGDDGGGVETRRRGQQVAPPGLQTPGESLESRQARAEALQLFPHPGVLCAESIHLPLKLHFLLLQGLALGNPFDPAAGGVPPVLQGAAPLLQLLDLLAGHAAQVEVQLPYREGHEFTV